MAAPEERTESRLASSRTVAVIGAGISGITAAAHLLRAGLSVTVFERSAQSGGVWNYDPQPAQDTPFPNERPSEGDYKPSSPGEHAYRTPPPEAGTRRRESDAAQSLDAAKGLDAAKLVHAPPSACYAGLKNNIPLPLMTTSLGRYPADAPDFGPWSTVLSYIKTISASEGVDAVTIHNTRVEEVKKHGEVWAVRTLALEAHAQGHRLTERNWEFDAVVVASGHYHTPSVPNIAGLDEWKARFPDRVLHSKQYRTPERFRRHNVLLVGGGVSSGDIARELDGVANKVFQSVRGGKFDLSAALLPANAQRVAGVKAFRIGSIDATDSDSSPSVVGDVALTDGTVLRGIDSVVLATGYLTSYPFLGHLHSDVVRAQEAGEDLIVTAEGAMTHNLYRDIFYISDPSLAFLGVPFHLSLFPTVDIQSQLVARVLSGQVGVPTRAKMREEYQDNVQRKGLSHELHSYLDKAAELDYVAGLVEWANRGARERGLAEIKGHSDELEAKYWQLREDAKGVFADPRAWGPA